MCPFANTISSYIFIFNYACFPSTKIADTLLRFWHLHSCPVPSLCKS